MSREAVCCASCLLLIFLDCTLGAPLSHSSKLTSYFEDQASRSRRSASLVDKTEIGSFFDIVQRSTRSLKSDYDDATYRIKTQDGQTSDLTKSLEQRRNRHRQDSDMDEELFERIIHFDSESLDRETRRSRRSAIFMLNAAIKLCDDRSEACGSIHYADDSFAMTISLNSDHGRPLPLRKRRSVDSDVEKEEEERLTQTVMNFGDDSKVTTQDRRQRRSAAFMLHAAIEMCNRKRSLCGKIHVSERKFSMTIRIADE